MPVEEEHGEENVVGSTESNIFSLEGKFEINANWLKDIHVSFRNTDYLLTESHVEIPGGEVTASAPTPEDGSHEEGPTDFTNKSNELRLVLNLSNKKLEQKAVVHYADEDTSIEGTEAFLLPAQSEELMLGYYLSKEWGQTHLDLGARFDMVKHSGAITDNSISGGVRNLDRENNGLNLALGIGRSFGETASLRLNLRSG